jgi:tetratricopeptide (TPR) repeat protein
MLKNNIGYSYYLAGNLQQAASWFTKAIQADANYRAAIKNLALLYARQGWYDRAVDTFAKAVDEPEAYNDAGYIAMRNGDLNKAIELLTKAIRLSPTYYELAYENLEQVNEQLDELARQARHNELAENKGNIVFPDGHQQKFRTVLPQTLNVRAEPSADAAVVEYLRAGNAVKIVASQPGWAFINHGTPSGGTVSGWVNTRFLKGEATAGNNDPLDATERNEQLSIDSTLDTAKPSEQLSIDEKLDDLTVDDARAWQPAPIAETAP